MNSNSVARSLLVVLSGSLLVACGAGSSGKVCSADSDCTAGKQICHPLAKFCVQTCTKGTDCSANEKSCAPLTEIVTTAQSICQCTTDANCGGGTGSSSICGTEDRVCEVKCTTDANCQGGRHCSASGQCLTPASSSVVCNPQKTTLGSAGGPDVCSYGQGCDPGSSVCVAAPVCTDTSVTVGAPAWSKGNPNAPVIASISATALSTTNTSTQCADGGPAGVVTLTYYSATGFTTQTSFSALQDMVKFNLGNGFVHASFALVKPAPGAQVGTMTFGICSASQHISVAAVYIKDDAGNASNTACTSW